MLVCPTCSRAFAADVRQCPHDGSVLELSGDGDDPMLGIIIDGRYKIEERVGAGGMGTVYRATQLNIHRDVAVKIVNAIALQNPETVRRFENEAHIISQLRHPSTLKLIDFGKLSDGRPYLVTEYLRGVSLEAVLAKGRRSFEWTLGVMRQVCDSLAEAHDKGIIHRDLKPENIFIEEVGEEAIVRVLDFGIAKLGKGSQTATGTVFGTPAYMSPEQAQGRGADPRSDLYSLGIIAYKCMSGMPPFVSDEPLALLLMHVNEPPTPLARACAPGAVPEVVERFVMSLIAKDPDARPARAVDVRLHIDQLLNRTPNPARIHIPTPAGGIALGPPTHEVSEPVAAFAPPTNTGTFKSSSPVRFVGVLLLSLAVAIVAGAFFSQEPDDVTSVESIIEDPPPIPLGAHSAEPAPPPAADEPAVQAGAEAAPDTKKPRRTKKRKKKKTSGKSTSAKSSADAEDGEDPPPGFLDFDVQ